MPVAVIESGAIAIFVADALTAVGYTIADNLVRAEKARLAVITMVRLRHGLGTWTSSLIVLNMRRCGRMDRKSLPAILIFSPYHLVPSLLRPWPKNAALRPNRTVPNYTW
ncbi:MAG: hypothetical protein OXE94_10665 [Aestuariivita sp.]|nr:hypothetical protein [Aestuariivita sp.]MCY4203191.1 hypothetical protein [Aestuariivita sp.]